ncbi:MAG: carboxypeptidase-like regulatory domain-containing protein [Polyangia bacterium]|jgi:hypothetical protein|nr:carboxypeptidase-like regulatory domain-containing protein [Polyangia bacterium]
MLCACSPFVHRAEFTENSDTVRPGDLLGPFTGRVLDAGTGKPIPSALVYASWEFVRGIGFVVPGGAETWVGRTSADGRYTIPALTRLPGGFTRAVARFRLVIYKRGYVAYRSDRIFPGDLGRHDFHQIDNKAQMERWSPELSHEEHLAFVGGSGLLTREAAWEVQSSLAQLAGASGGTTPVATASREQLLDASSLLDEDDLEEITGSAGPFQADRLPDLPRSPRYDSLHFRAEGKSQRFDSAYRVWKLGRDAEKHYVKLLAAYPQTKPDDRLGERSFQSQSEHVLARVWLARSPGVVVSLTCGRDLCKDFEVLEKLAQVIHRRLEQLDKPLPAAPGTPLSPGVNPFQPVSPRDPVLQ